MKYLKSFKLFENQSGNLKYKSGDIVYVFQFHSKPNSRLDQDEIRDYYNVDKKYVVGKGYSTQKWCKVEILEPMRDEPGWETYKVKQLDGYRKEEEFVAYQNQMSLFNDKPISIGYSDVDTNR